MPEMFFGTSAYSRERGNLPELPVINMFVEPSPATDTGIVLQSRPGLAQMASVGEGPIRGMFQKDGALGGDRFAVSGNKLYRNISLLGSVEGVDVVSFAASPARLLVTLGTRLYRYDGTSLVADTMPDSQNVVATAYLAGYEIAVAKGTNTFYFRQYTSDTFDGLDYANAENEPDEIRDVLAVNDVLVFLGSESVEFWPKTGDANIPFAPTEGRVYAKGVIGTGCATEFDNTFAWIGNNRIVYIGANVPQRISDFGIEERIKASTTFALFSYFFEGSEFLVLRLSQGTWLFSAATRQWSEFQSYGRSNWRARCALPGPVFGDDETGAIWSFGTGHVDAGGVLERRFRAAIPVSGGAFSANNVRLSVNVGETPNLTGDYANPVIEMRTSRDAARTFDAWRPISLGEQGKYRTLTEWRRCGMFDAPGMVAEFRVTDPVPLRASRVGVNEQSGGRGR
jgi:hypothetical protein